MGRKGPRHTQVCPHTPGPEGRRVGSRPSPIATLWFCSLCSKMRSTCEFPQGSTAPLPVPALPLPGGCGLAALCQDLRLR